jgi:hypothetical protein
VVIAHGLTSGDVGGYFETTPDPARLAARNMISSMSSTTARNADSPLKSSDPVKVPVAAAWLGGLGAIPFVGLALALPLCPAALRLQLDFALLSYGAIILSFLGGIRWGLAIGQGSETSHRLLALLGLSVTPSLVAWAALMMPNEAGWMTLAAGFVVMLAIDILAARSGDAPSWYPVLRWPLTAAAVASLLLGNLQ